MSPAIKAAFVLTGVFVLGGVTGGAIVRISGNARVRSMLEQPTAARQRLFMITLDHEVHLEKDQREKVRQILRQREQELREANHECAPRMRVIRKTAMAEVRALMHKDQLEDFDHFAAEMERANSGFTADQVGDTPR